MNTADRFVIQISRGEVSANLSINLTTDLVFTKCYLLLYYTKSVCYCDLICSIRSVYQEHDQSKQYCSIGMQQLAVDTKTLFVHVQAL